MAENIYKNEVDRKYNNQKSRSKMTATEMAAYTALSGQSDEASASAKAIENVNKAESLGLFEDSMSFLHLFTKNIDVSVKSTRFKGKRGHQVRGGMVDIAPGLVTDYTPAVLRADKNRDRVYFDNDNTKPQIVFVDRKNDNSISYLPIKVDKQASYLENGSLMLYSSMASKIPLDNKSLLSYEGLEISNNELKFIGPKVISRDEETGNFDKETEVNSAVIDSSGLNVDKKEEKNILALASTLPRVSALAADSEFDQDIDSKLNDAIDEVDISDIGGDSADSDSTLEVDPEVLAQKARLASPQGSNAPAMSVDEPVVTQTTENVQPTQAEKKEETSGERLLNDAEDLLGEVDRKLIAQAIGLDSKKEKKDDGKPREKDEEIPVSDFIVAFINGDTKSVAGKRIAYAQKLLTKFAETKDAEFTPDDDILKELHLQTSGEDELSKGKVNGYTFEGDINILPWLYGFATFTPSFVLKIDTNYKIAPEAGVDVFKFAETSAARLNVGKKVLVGDEVGQQKHEEIMVKQKDMEKVLLDVIASVKVSVGVSVALVGKLDAEVALGLGVGNPFLFGIEGYVGGDLQLAGNGGKKGELINLSAKSKLSLDELGSGSRDKLLSNIAKDSTLDANMGLDLTGSAKVAARVRSRLLSIDYDLKEFVEASYKFASVNYDAKLKKTPGGRFLGYDVDTVFSAEALGKSIKKNDVTGKYGFEFNKKDSAMESTMEVLNQGQDKANEINQLIARVKDYEGKDLSKLEKDELTALRDKLKTETYEIERLIKATSNANDMLNNSTDFQEDLKKTFEELKKHQDIINKLDEWKESGGNLAETYAQYLSINGNDKSLDKSIKAGIRNEAIPAFASRDRLLAYERAKLAEDSKKSDAMLAKLAVLVDQCNVLDMDVVNEAFTQGYMKETVGFFSKGITSSVANYADPEMIREYERGQIALETQSHQNRIDKLNDYIEKNKITDLQKPNEGMANFYINTLKATKLKNNLINYALNIDDVIAYEENHINQDDGVKQLFNTYKILKEKKDLYDNAKTKNEKNKYQKEMNTEFLKGYSLDDIRDNAYRMAGVEDLIAHENEVWEGKFNKATKYRKDSEGNLDFDKLRKANGAKVSEVIKEQASIENLLDFESKRFNSLKEGNKNPLMLAVVERRRRRLSEAKQQLATYENDEEAARYASLVKNDYFSGVFDAEATYGKGNLRKKEVKELDFVNSYLKDKSLRSDQLNKKVIQGMVSNIRDSSGAENYERIENLQKMYPSGKSNSQIYHAYKDSLVVFEERHFKRDIKDRYKDMDLANLSPTEMLRFAEYKMQMNTRSTFKIRKEGEKGSDAEEYININKKEGHFGRWERLVALKQDKEFNALSPEDKRIRLYSFYTKELLGGNKLNELMANNYLKYMTPAVIMDYEGQRVNEISYKRRKRLEALDGKIAGDDISEYRDLAKNDGEGIGKTFKWLWELISGDYTIDYDAQADAEKILTPANIFDYEQKKADNATKKHRERVDMLMNAEGKSDKEVYDAYLKMGGGNGFLTANASNIRKEEDRLLASKYNSGNYSLDIIKNFENDRIAKLQEKANSLQGLTTNLVNQLKNLFKLYSDVSKLIAQLG